MFTPKSLREEPMLVISTGVPLSTRFKTLPSHNPLRPNPNLSAQVAQRSVSLADDDDEVGLPFAPRKPFKDASFLRAGANTLSVLNPQRDVEILRLRAQLRAAQLRLKIHSQQNQRGRSPLTLVHRNPMKNRLRAVITSRSGGGITIKRAGNGKGLGLALRSKAAALKLLGPELGMGISPLKGGMMKKNQKGNSFFGSPKSKEDLDKELDAYMSKKKKGKDDLDKELDAYMAARSQSKAAVFGNIATPAPPTETATAVIPAVAPDADNVNVDEDLDSEMELAD